jgi:hypothetical protein
MKLEVKTNSKWVAYTKHSQTVLKTSEENTCEFAFGSEIYHM